MMAIDGRKPYVRALHAMVNEETTKIVLPTRNEILITKVQTNKCVSGYLGTLCRRISRIISVLDTSPI